VGGMGVGDQEVPLSDPAHTGTTRMHLRLINAEEAHNTNTHRGIDGRGDHGLRGLWCGVIAGGWLGVVGDCDGTWYLRGSRLDSGSGGITVHRRTGCMYGEGCVCACVRACVSMRVYDVGGEAQRHTERIVNSADVRRGSLPAAACARS
jgi:hypothetical protein